MDDLSDKIAKLLSDPDSLEKIKSVAGQFAGKSDAPKEETVHTREDADPPGDQEPAVEASASGSEPKEKSEPGIFDLIGSMDANTLSTVMKLFGAFKQDKDDQHMLLLHALKPYLRDERKRRFDDVVRMMKIKNIIGAVSDGGFKL